MTSKSIYKISKQENIRYLFLKLIISYFGNSKSESQTTPKFDLESLSVIKLRNPNNPQNVITFSFNTSNIKSYLNLDFDFNLILLQRYQVAILENLYKKMEADSKYPFEKIFKRAIKELVYKTGHIIKCNYIEIYSGFFRISSNIFSFGKTKGLNKDLVRSICDNTFFYAKEYVDIIKDNKSHETKKKDLETVVRTKILEILEEKYSEKLKDYIEYTQVKPSREDLNQIFSNLFFSLTNEGRITSISFTMNLNQCNVVIKMNNPLSKPILKILISSLYLQSFDTYTLKVSEQMNKLKQSNLFGPDFEIETFIEDQSILSTSLDLLNLDMCIRYSGVDLESLNNVTYKRENINLLLNFPVYVNFFIETLKEHDLLFFYEYDRDPYLGLENIVSTQFREVKEKAKAFLKTSEDRINKDENMKEILELLKKKKSLSLALVDKNFKTLKEVYFDKELDELQDELNKEKLPVSNSNKLLKKSKGKKKKQSQTQESVSIETSNQKKVSEDSFFYSRIDLGSFINEGHPNRHVTCNIEQVSNGFFVQSFNPKSPDQNNGRTGLSKNLRKNQTKRANVKTTKKQTPSNSYSRIPFIKQAFHSGLNVSVKTSKHIRDFNEGTGENTISSEEFKEETKKTEIDENSMETVTVFFRTPLIVIFRLPVKKSFFLILKNIIYACRLNESLKQKLDNLCQESSQEQKKEPFQLNRKLSITGFFLRTHFLDENYMVFEIYLGIKYSESFTIIGGKNENDLKKFSESRIPFNKDEVSKVVRNVFEFFSSWKIEMGFLKEIFEDFTILAQKIIQRKYLNFSEVDQVFLNRKVEINSLNSNSTAIVSLVHSLNLGFKESDLFLSEYEKDEDEKEILHTHVGIICSHQLQY